MLPVITYSSETVTLTLATAKKVKIIQRKMERSTHGVTPTAHIRNAEVNDVVSVKAKMELVRSYCMNAR